MPVMTSSEETFKTLLETVVEERGLQVNDEHVCTCMRAAQNASIRDRTKFAQEVILSVVRMLDNHKKGMAFTGSVPELQMIVAVAERSKGGCDEQKRVRAIVEAALKGDDGGTVK